MTRNPKRPTVTQPLPRRKAFRAALALADTTQTEWARSQGITPEHVSQVLAGKRESRRLIEKVDEFIASQLPQLVA